jgi:serine/threonine protein kinase
MRKNLCIVTEYVKRGSLRDVLSDASVALGWPQKLRLLRSAALGVHYLHALEPHPILHRHLTSSTLLVIDDACTGVKVSGFGFARMKLESQTMTGRCGSPCWTAPEVLMSQGRHRSAGDGDNGDGDGDSDERRYHHYDEKADVYSFGVVMWEVLTRQQPFAGRPFIEVALDVIAGRRPPLPPAVADNNHQGDEVVRGCFQELVARCWHAEPEQRPTMEQVVCTLDRLLTSVLDNSLDHVV